MEGYSFTYGDSKIEYEVRIKPTQSNKVRINVLPDGAVRVDAPAGADKKTIRQAVIKRSRWIHKHVESTKNRKKHVLPREYVSGETHFYLGKQYLLKIYLRKNQAEQVKLAGGHIEIITHSRDAQHIRTLLDTWYKKRAAQVFTRRLQAQTEVIAWLKQPPVWKLRDMKKQWGSCSPKGVLSLNPKLVKASRECIDYVIIHELCHLKEHNHSANYYRLLKRALPEWKGIKERLDGMVEKLVSS